MMLSMPQRLPVFAAANTPAAGPDSRTYTGLRAASAAGVRPPATTVIGAVAGFVPGAAHQRGALSPSTHR